MKLTKEQPSQLPPTKRDARDSADKEGGKRLNRFHAGIRRWIRRSLVRWWRTLTADTMVRPLWIYRQIGLRVLIPML